MDKTMEQTSSNIIDIALKMDVTHVYFRSYHTSRVARMYVSKHPHTYQNSCGRQKYYLE